MTLRAKINSACILFEKTKINFGNFCDMVGEVLELASPLEAKRIGELTRELELAMFSENRNDVKTVLQTFQKEFYQIR